MLRKTAFSALLSAALFTGAEAVALRALVVPGIPTENDSLVARAHYWSPMGSELLDTLTEITGDTVRVRLSYTPTCGGEANPCLPGIELKEESVRLGKLPPGRYTLLFTVRTVHVVLCNNPPCDPHPVDSLTDTTLFDVANSSRAVPVLSGFHYFANPEMVSGSGSPGKMYRYTSGDTLFLALKHTTGCCTKYDPYLTGSGDTLIVMLSDTGDPCDCGARHACATAVIANAPGGFRYARIQRYGEMTYSDGAFSSTTIMLDSAAPSVCINVKDTVSKGYRLYVDSTWTSYEMVAPSLTHSEYLRLQPGNGAHVGSATRYMYLDSIACTDGLIEEFEREDFSLWKVNTSWNGVLLQPARRENTAGHLLELGYADLTEQGITTSMHRKRSNEDVPLETTEPLRIFIKASSLRPEGTGTVRRSAPRPQLSTTGLRGIRMVVDAKGRMVFKGANTPELILPADGLYFHLRERGATQALIIGK